MNNAKAIEPTEQHHRTFKKRLQLFIFDSILAIQLANQKLRITSYAYSFLTHSNKLFEAHQQTLILRDIIRGAAKVTAELFHHRAMFVVDDGARACFSRVS